MRNVDVRPTMLQALSAHPALLNSWQRLADSVATEFPALAEQMRRTARGTRNQDIVRLDQQLEKSLVSSLEKFVPVVLVRSDVRAFLYAQVYLFRNWIFRIKTSTKQPVLADRYLLNQQALVAALRVARQQHVPVLLYVIPLNRTADAPYVATEYDAFKTWLEQTAAA